MNAQKRYQMTYNGGILRRRVIMTLGPTIRRLREERGLKVYQLGNLIGVDASYVGRIEKGRVENVGSELIGKIAEALQVSTDYLYAEGGWLPPLYDPGELDLTERRLIEMLRSIPTASLKQRVLEQLTWIAEVARDADLARQPALRLAADEREGYQAEEDT